MPEMKVTHTQIVLTSISANTTGYESILNALAENAAPGDIETIKNHLEKVVKKIGKLFIRGGVLFNTDPIQEFFLSEPATSENATKMGFEPSYHLPIKLDFRAVSRMSRLGIGFPSLNAKVAEILSNSPSIHQSRKIEVFLKDNLIELKLIGPKPLNQAYVDQLIEQSGFQIVGSNDQSIAGILINQALENIRNVVFLEDQEEA